MVWLRAAARAARTLRLSHVTRDNRAIKEARIIEVAETAPASEDSFTVLAHLRASAPYAETFNESKVRYKTIEQGAATSVFVATSPQLDGIGGRYFEDCNQAPVLDRDAPNTRGSGVAAYALDPAHANRLWELSLALLGLEQQARRSATQTTRSQPISARIRH
jgi:hypothetical protein